MKRFGLTTLTALMTMFFLLTGFACAEGLGDLRISLLDGDVQIKTIDTGDWVPAAINTPLQAGDILWVPDEGKAGIQLRDGSTIRLNENTSLEVLTLENNSYQPETCAITVKQA